MHCRLAERGRVEPCDLGKLERLQVVVGEHLGLILGSAERLDPGRRLPVFERAGSAGDLPVRDVADEQVAEDELAFRGDRRDAGAPEELLALEREQQLLGLRPGDAADRLDGA